MRARVRGIALFVACEIQPLNNLRVQRHLARSLGMDRSGLSQWQQHWIQVGFDALEQQLSNDPATGSFCHGDRPTLADCFLIPPDIFTTPFGLPSGADLSHWPTLERIWKACLALPAFDCALPTHQPDFESPDGH